MKDILKEKAPYILSALLADGGEFAEIFYEDLRSTTLNLEDNKIEKVSFGIDFGVGLRLIKNYKTIYGYTSDLSFDNLMKIAKTLAKAEGEGKVLVGQKYAKNKVEVLIDPDDFSLSRKRDILLRANDIARAYSDKIVQVSATLRDVKRDIMIINSLGETVEDSQTRVVFFVEAVASDKNNLYRGYESTGGSIGYELFNEDFVNPIDYVATKAAERAVLGLGAKPAPAGSMPVVISSEAGGTMIHEAVGHGLEADLVSQGLSVYAGKIGQKVASELVTVIDDATLKNKNGSFNFDDEGVPAQRKVLIENGILKGYMYDRLRAMKEGKQSTGNGRRDSYKQIPIVRMTNTYIDAGKDNPHDIIADTKYGVYVVKMGGGQVNTVNGDFVFEVMEGYMIENGKITYPIKGASLIGNGPKALQDIDAVGYDLGWAIGTCGKSGQRAPVSDAQPTLRIKSMTIGGTAI
ncbi:TldD/PmbA family protein [Venenivibrio stagnispumantis]|uniref:TldD protein n=1 Tax=Venenivibrio stagnispumantis TaxID=407998 RepID=A0AA45WMA0_9AQUI|nr:TldD/PmbA family protein [Venenivibrio stagnispumantis]MCW4572823.1 TldD/PmbA family protein [Venenivibrio stagnispumantis]SMP13537.1 TldD protein [Venenivibrio stagnispumantis]